MPGVVATSGRQVRPQPARGAVPGAERRFGAAVGRPRRADRLPAEGQDAEGGQGGRFEEGGLGK